MSELTDDDRRRIAEAIDRYLDGRRERDEEAEADRAMAEAIAVIESLPRATPNEQFPTCFLRADIN